MTEMDDNIILTEGGTRLTLVKSNEGKFNWLFIPGGLGMGAEYFYPLTENLQLPGKLWHVDLPNNGSNRSQPKSYDYSAWLGEMTELGALLPNTIMVGHSCGGMLILAQEKLQQNLTGVVLINTSPCNWIAAADKAQRDAGLEGLEKFKQHYRLNPSDKAFRQVLKEAVPYMATPPQQKKLAALFKKLPINYLAFNWTMPFKLHYEAKWIPEVPTLIIGAEKDMTIPNTLFKQDMRFDRENISAVEIVGGSHFCWLEAPDAVAKAFLQYAKSL